MLWQLLACYTKIRRHSALYKTVIIILCSYTTGNAFCAALQIMPLNISFSFINAWNPFMQINAYVMSSDGFILTNVQNTVPKSSMDFSRKS